MPRRLVVSVERQYTWRFAQVPYFLLLVFFLLLLVVLMSCVLARLPLGIPPMSFPIILALFRVLSRFCLMLCRPFHFNILSLSGGDFRGANRRLRHRLRLRLLYHRSRRIHEGS
jgi:hypothetical protein